MSKIHFGFVAALTLTLGAISGCSGSSVAEATEGDDEMEASGSEDALRLLEPGPCLVGTIKRNRSIVIIDAQDSMFRQAGFDWTRMSHLTVNGVTTMGAGRSALFRAVRNVRLPARADLTCVAANPPVYDVRILP